ncbi:MAG: hypothetical protein NT039_02020 [Candidatus Berkelbacteria bacterium]|nr:hypothetical protein [Candidatus Berkelbacteria bacterium]
MDNEKRKRINKILFIAALIFTALTIIVPLLSLISENLKLASKYAPSAIFIWVIIWITILRLSQNYKIPRIQNRLLIFLVIASSIAFTGFILYCFK